MNYLHALEQGSAIYGLQARSGPPPKVIWPAVSSLSLTKGHFSAGRDSGSGTLQAWTGSFTIPCVTHGKLGGRLPKLTSRNLQTTGPFARKGCLALS